MSHKKEDYALDGVPQRKFTVQVTCYSDDDLTEEQVRDYLAYVVNDFADLGFVEIRKDDIQSGHLW